MGKKGIGNRTIYHIVPRDKGWGVKKAESSRCSSIHRKKSTALKKAKRLAKESKPSQVKIHKRDGTFQREHTYGPDPVKYPR